MRHARLGVLVAAAIWATGCGDSEAGSDSVSGESSVGSASKGTSNTGPSTGGSTANSSASETGGQTTAGPTGSDSGVEGDAPVILSFGTNVTQITEGESVSFSAVVTDPDGIADVIGGQLTNPDGTIVYGTFVATGMEGAYEIVVSWGAIDQTETIEFEGVEDSRIFRAEFYDQAANTATASIELTFHCDGIAACGGSCTDLMNDYEHCGSCARQCDYFSISDDEWGKCDFGACTNSVNGCISEGDGLSNCSEYCSSIGEDCAEQGCLRNGQGDFTDVWFSDQSDCESFTAAAIGWNATCADEFSYGNFKKFVRCCCTDNV